MNDWFSMSGHGLYIWGSYLVTALVIVLEMLLLRQRRKAVLEQLQQEAELAEEIAKSNESKT